MVEEYSFGRMVVAGTPHLQDLKIVGGRVLRGWWRREGHSMYIEDALDILAAKPSVLVVGTGHSGRMQVDQALRTALLDAGIELIEEPTARAALTFNRLQENGENVAGAFHLTC